MQEQQIVSQSEKPVWEAPELTQSDVNTATLLGGAATTDGLGNQS